ncbi:MAG: thiamine diphosphokinase [Pseudobdellovibrio sp.]
MSLNKFTTVIIADGLFPTKPQELFYLENAEQVVCCDGAVMKLLASGLRNPDWIIGDLDSVAAKVQDHFKNKIIIDANQETNDLTKAFQFCLMKGWKSICFLGITGLRDDHNLANLFLLFDYSEKADVIAPTSFGIFSVVNNKAELKSFSGQQVSFFCADKETIVDCENLKWPLIQKKFDKVWAGSLNESTSDVLKIRTSSGPVLVFQKYD